MKAVQTVVEENLLAVRLFLNSVNEKSRKSNPGIGLENVRKRLDLIYGERYDLKVEDSTESYCVTLKIPVLNGDEVHSN